MKYALISVTLAALILPFAALAAETQTVVATGYGTTADDAKKAAIRAAVEQVVGSMVDAETLVENDELVRDEILSYSAGLVESAEFVGEPRKTPAGLVEVRIRAVVKKTEIEAKLPKSEKVVREVSGQSLFAKRVSGKQNLEDAEAVMKKVFDPEKVRACVKADLVPLNEDGAVLDVDPATGEVFADVKVWVDMDAYKKWTKEIVEKIGPMATKRREVVSKHQNDGFSDYLSWTISDEPRNTPLKLLAILENERPGKLILFTMEEEKWKRLRACVSELPCHSLKTCLLDASGEELKIDEKILLEQLVGRHSFPRLGIVSVTYPALYDVAAVICNPFLAMGSGTFENNPDPYRPAFSGNVYGGVSSHVFRVSFGKMDESDLSDIAKIAVEIVPYSGQ